MEESLNFFVVVTAVFFSFLSKHKSSKGERLMRTKSPRRAAQSRQTFHADLSSGFINSGQKLFSFAVFVAIMFNYKIYIYLLIGVDLHVSMNPYKGELCDIEKLPRENCRVFGLNVVAGWVIRLFAHVNSSTREKIDS